MSFSQKNTSALPAANAVDCPFEIADRDELERVDRPALRARVHERHQMRPRARVG